MTITGSLAAGSVLLLSLGIGTANWQVDKDDTQVNFEARHFVTAVRGQFRDFDVKLTYDVVGAPIRINIVLEAQFR